MKTQKDKVERRSIAPAAAAIATALAVLCITRAFCAPPENVLSPSTERKQAQDSSDASGSVRQGMPLRSASTKSEKTAKTLEPESDKDALKRGFTQTKTYQADKAIENFTPLLVHAAKKNWHEAGNRELVARYLCLIGRSFTLDDNATSASHCFYLAHRLTPGNATITMFLADSWNRSGRAQDALPLYEQAAAAASTETNPVVLRLLARWYQHSEDYKHSQTLIEQALKQKDGAGDWRLHQILSRALLRQGYLQRALAESKLAAKYCDDKYTTELLKSTTGQFERKPKETEEHLREAGRILPADPSWQLNLCKNLGDSKDSQGYKYGISALQSRRFTIGAPFWYAVNKLGSKDFDEAERALRYLEVMAPGNEATVHLRASLAVVRQQKDKAIKAFEQLLARDRRYPGAYVSFSEYLLRIKQRDRAIQVLQDGVKQVPAWENGWRRLGELQIETDPKTARVSFETALALLPKDIEALNELGRHEIAILNAGIGTCEYLDKDTDGALASAIKFNELKFEPQLPWFLKLLVVRPGRIVLGKTVKERAWQNHVLLADMLFQEHKYNQCIDEYRAATALNPDDVDIHTCLMGALSEVGDYVGAARENWETSNKIVNKIPGEIGKAMQKKPAESKK